MARKTLLTESEIRQFMKLANLGPLGDAKIEEMYGKAHDRDEDELEEGRGGDDDDDLDEGRGDKKDDDLDEGRGGKVMDRDEDELDEMGMRGAMDRDEDEMMGDAEMDMGDAEMDMDAAADDMDADMGGMGDAEREEVMADVVRAVAQALGIEDQVSVEAGEDDGMEGGDMDAMPEPALDDEPAAEPDMAMGADDEDDDPMMEADDDEELRRTRERNKRAKEKQRSNRPGGMKMKGVTSEELNEDDLVAEVARRVAERLQTENRKEQMVDALAERIMKRLTQK